MSIVCKLGRPSLGAAAASLRNRSQGAIEFRRSQPRGCSTLLRSACAPPLAGILLASRLSPRLVETVLQHVLRVVAAQRSGSNASRSVSPTLSRSSTSRT